MRRNWRKGQLRLGWAGHARGRGLAAGCRYNSRPGKSFLDQNPLYDRDPDREELSTPGSEPAGIMNVVAEGFASANPLSARRTARSADGCKLHLRPTCLKKTKAPSLKALESGIERRLSDRVRSAVGQQRAAYCSRWGLHTAISPASGDRLPHHLGSTDVQG
jgi:hypothetical protein